LHITSVANHLIVSETSIRVLDDILKASTSSNSSEPMGAGSTGYLSLLSFALSSLSSLSLVSCLLSILSLVSRLSSLSLVSHSNTLANELLLTGWVRDLIREGVEPNPGPTFLDLKSIVTNAFTKAYSTAIDAFFNWLAAQLDEGENSDVFEILAWQKEKGAALLSSYKQEHANVKPVQTIISRFLEELQKNG